jgi:hypothetical protein
MRHLQTTVYYNKGGWNGYIDTTATVIVSGLFVVTHIQQVNINMLEISIGRFNVNALIDSRVAGLVLIKNQVDVPEPSTLAIFALGMIGLASRRFKKQS